MSHADDHHAIERNALRAPPSRRRKERPLMVMRLTLVVLGLTLGVPSLLQAESPTGKLAGRITYSGSALPDQTAEITRDSAFCGTSTTIKDVVIHPKTRGLEGVVVSIESGNLPSSDAPLAPLVLTNTHCAFLPRTVIGQVGQQLEIRSDDPVMHNTHISLGSRTFVNVAMIPASRPVRKPLKQPGIYTVKCDAHKFMHADVIAFAHPFFTQTDESGSFQITNLPPGEHVVNIWHHTLGSYQQTVRVSAEAETTIAFDFAAHAESNKK